MNIIRIKTSALLLAVFAVFVTAQAGTIHVAPGGAGTGTSWSDPLGDIQAAVDAGDANASIARMTNSLRKQEVSTLEVFTFDMLYNKKAWGEVCPDQFGFQTRIKHREPRISPCHNCKIR